MLRLQFLCLGCIDRVSSTADFELFKRIAGFLLSSPGYARQSAEIVACLHPRVPAQQVHALLFLLLFILFYIFRHLFLLTSVGQIHSCLYAALNEGFVENRSVPCSRLAWTLTREFVFRGLFENLNIRFCLQQTVHSL